MIAGIFHQGSGLGNQLHRYVATRALALDKGYEWAMLYSADGSGKEENFKGSSFFKGNFWGGETKDVRLFNKLYPNTILFKNQWQEKKVLENGVDIRSYDPEFNFVQDNTIIDGEFQDERYWEHREKEVDQWLKVEPLKMPDDLCVIGFRGGEFKVFPDLFLPKEYWDRAIEMMKKINPNMKFEVHTDDWEEADAFLSKLVPKNTRIVHDIGRNWRSMRYAKYAIIANTSFCILPRWLNGGITIAPRYWARHNTKVWALPQNYYKRFTYI